MSVEDYRAHGGPGGILLDPIEAFLAAERWSQTQQQLEVTTDELFRPETLEAMAARAKASDDARERAWIESRVALLRAAHRFGVFGAYAFAQGFGQRGVIGAELIQEFTDAVQDTARLQDLCDRHPILLSIYQKMVRGSDPTGPLPPRLPPAADAAFSALWEILTTKTAPAAVIDRLDTMPNQLDARLYPGLCGAIHLQLAEARVALDSTDAGLSDAMRNYDTARAIFIPDRFPIDHGETALRVGHALLARGHAERAIVELETAIDYLNGAAREDKLLMAVAPRSAEEIGALRARAELLCSEALWKARRYKTAGERAREIETHYAASAPDTAAMACLLQVHIAMVEEGRDPDDRVRTAEHACRHGIEYLKGVDSAPDTRMRLQAQLIQLLLRPEGYGIRERVAEAEKLLQETSQAVKDESPAAAELKLVEHQYITEHGRRRGWKKQARECAREILRLAKVLRDPRLEAEGHVRRGDAATGKAAVTYYRRAADRFARIGEQDRQVEVLGEIGDLHFEAAEWEAAVRAHEQIRAVEPRLAGHAADAYARSIKTSAFASKAAYAAHKLGLHREAFEINETGKARFLTAMAAPRVREERDLLSLGRGAVIIAPVVTSHGSIAFVVPGNARSVSTENVIESETNHRVWTDLLATWINAYFQYTREQDIGRWETAVTDTCKRVWELLMCHVLGRMEELGVRQGSPVLFIPPNLLAPLPFHAACDPKGAYPFTDQYPLAYAPGLRVLPDRLSGPPAAKMLAFIDPAGDLPFARYELRCLERYAHGGPLLAFNGPRAQCDRFFEHARGIGYIHFACHAFNQWAKPLETAIKLADAGLGALSFLGSDVDLGQTRLACLSACETGITTAFRRVYGNTTTFGGEEYIGLPGALHAAGAESVLSTLWPVEDYVATLLIEQFYRLHFVEKLECFQAFCEARQSLRERTADATIGDVRRRLSEPDVTEEVAGYLAGIEAFVQHNYAPEDRPFDHPNCWAPYVLSGRPGGRQAKSS